MRESILKHRRLLMLDRDLDFLSGLKTEIMGKCPDCQVDMATTFVDGRQLMLLLTYDLVISDPMDTPGSDLMNLAGGRRFPVLVLQNGIDPWETLSRFKKLKVPAVVPKENVKDITSTLEQVLKRTGRSWWRRVLASIGKLSPMGLVRFLPEDLDELIHCEHKTYIK